MLALIVGSLLAVSALAFVLLPLLVPGASSVGPRTGKQRIAPARGEDEAVVALREIEFDRATGKLSDADYEELRTRYTRRALESLRANAVSPEDVAEAAVFAYRSRLRSCVTCGPRSEVDANYCSSCGIYLPGTCGSCGAVVNESGAAFCTACGRELAA
ncbi:MAG: zinc ribbon domain-containing protein [Gemmatimonadaceae bacterium]